MDAVVSLKNVFDPSKSISSPSSSMAPISMDLKIISCKDLKAFNFFQKLSVYATVCIATQDSTQRHQHHKTLTDTDGDGNPEWNHKTQLDLSKFDPADLDHLFLEFEFISQGGLLLGEKLIGQVRVPIEDLLQDSTGALRFVSYQVVSSEGNPNGVFEFSYKVLQDKVSAPPPPIQYPEMYSSPEVFYPPPPTTDVFYPPPPASEVFYPPIETSGASYPPLAMYPPQEVCYSPPAGEEMHSFYPPLPPPSNVYPAPPTSYGSVYDEYSSPTSPAYPSVDPFRQPYDSTWRNHLQGGEGYVGN